MTDHRDFFLLETRMIGQVITDIPTFCETQDDSNFASNGEFDNRKGCTAALFGVDAAGLSMAVLLTEYRPCLRFLLPDGSTKPWQVAAKTRVRG